PVLAAAAAALLYVAPTAAPPAPEYTVRSVRALAEVRGAASAEARVKVDGHTRFVAIVEPARELDGAAPAVRVLVAREGGVLEAVPERAVTIGVGGVVKIEAPSSELFTRGPGRYAIHVAIAQHATALAELVGREPEAARGPGLGWLEIGVERIDDGGSDR
ncbi:hypothetical protein L6R52_37480, partial [Myxococcota bacterium]|nr:hypothetical protein [Myxococcota bacterium]